MFRIFFLLFILVPAVEIALFIKIGGMIGVLSTLLLIVMTALLGAGLLRYQGLMTLSRVQEHLQQGRMPAVELVEGMILLICGAFLLTPGFFTDTIGFLMLVPRIRRRVAFWLLVNVLRGFQVHVPAPPDPHAANRTSHTIEGKFTRKDD